jgi:hypothetical protein
VDRFLSFDRHELCVTVRGGDTGQQLVQHLAFDLTEGR